jgi:hypothetical protein
MKMTRDKAIALCMQLEEAAPMFGGHVALTGGCLYKTGERKDVDIMIYRSTDEPPFKWDEFFAEIKLTLGIELVHDFGFCKKARMGEHTIDFFDPFGVYNGESGAVDLSAAELAKLITPVPDSEPTF